MHNSNPLYFRGSASGGKSNRPVYLKYGNVRADILVIENTWISMKDLTSAMSPNATISAASPILAVCSAIKEKYIASMADPKHLACAHTQIASATLA